MPGLMNDRHRLLGARFVGRVALLVAERGPEHVTMREVAEAVGVGKGTTVRRSGDRDGFLLAFLDEAEAEFPEAYTSGPLLWDSGPPADRLASFGCALSGHTASDVGLLWAGRHSPFWRPEKWCGARCVSWRREPVGEGPPE